MFERKPYFAPRELAAQVGISHDTVLRMIHAGELFAVKLGPKTYRVPLGAALAVFAPHEIAPGAQTMLPAGSADRAFGDLAVSEGRELEAARPTAAASVHSR